ncbi:MAG: hypothetical protein ABJA80_16655 [bacterium]
MTRRLFAVAVAAVLASVPGAARAQRSFVVSGGLNAPVGRLGDVTDLGYHVAAGLNLGAPIVPVGARLELGYSGLGYKAGGGDVRIISGTANAIFNLGPTNDAPYLIAGVGAYNRSSGSSNFGYGSGATVAGINGGAGLRFPLSGLSTFFEARYHIMLGNANEDTNYQFIPITFGIAF